MTLLELHNTLCKVISDITDETKTPKEHQKILENAEYVAKICKQAINNADIILRTDRLCNTTARINSIVGDKDVGTPQVDTSRN